MCKSLATLLVAFMSRTVRIYSCRWQHEIALISSFVQKKLSGRFTLSPQSNVVLKWKATGTVLVKERCGRPTNIGERHRRRMVKIVREATDHLQRTTRISGCCWCSCSPLLCTRKSSLEGWCAKSLSWGFVTRSVAWDMQKHIWTSQKHFGRKYCGQMRLIWSYLVITRGGMHGEKKHCIPWK